jgi:hypothetical protein
MKKSNTLADLPERKRRYLENRIAGMSKYDAGIDAGFTESVSRNAASRIETPDVRKAFRELMMVACPAEKLAKRIQEGLDATETKLFAHDGKVADQREVPHYAERRQYAELAVKYGGYVEEKSSNVNVGQALNIHIKDI